MLRNQIIIAFLILALASGPLSAQEATQIPDVVVEQCMAQNDASKLPDCLKEGAYGHYMLQIASSFDIYGENAAQVIEACTKQNDDFRSAWTCFDVAARKAMETRELVGLDKIADQCVVAVSDPTIYARLEVLAKEQRRIRFPDEMFSGGTMYQPFRGCSS
jgi:hypothetical protein